MSQNQIGISLENSMDFSLDYFFYWIGPLQWQFAWQTRELCLHYFSNSVKFKFGQDTHDVYRVDQIKEWAELENPIWLDNLREKLFKIAGH